MRKKILSLFFAYVLVFINFAMPTPAPAQQISRPVTLRKIAVPISSAQILAMNVTPVTLVPAPGAGLVLVPVAAFLVWNFGGTPYTSGASNLLLEYNAQTGVNAFGSTTISTVITGGASEIRIGFSQANTIAVLTNAANLPITARLSAAATLGNGTMTLTIYYDIVPAT